MGFTFDDSDHADDETPGVPSPIATMERLIAENPKNAEAIFPYLGGEDVNSSPTHAHRRHVIDFRDRSEEECWREWPQLMALVERKVKPERTRKKPNGEFALRSPLPDRWWHHADKRPALYAVIEERDKIFAIACRAVVNLGIAQVCAKTVFDQALVVFSEPDFAHFACISSRLHENWMRFLCSSIGDIERYSPTDCYVTFAFPFSGDAGLPFPSESGSSAFQCLEAIGAQYLRFREDLMSTKCEGLTSTYNRFHDPAETNPDHLELRRLHGEMDQAVLAAYGWSDVPTACGFGLDYLDLEEDAQLPEDLQERIDSGELFFWDAGDALDFQGQLQAYGAITGRRKLPWRYRWPDAVRDDVLARLLALNAERYAEEVAMGLQGKGGKSAAPAAGPGGGKRRGRPPKASSPGETDPTQTEQMGLGL